MPSDTVLLDWLERWTDRLIMNVDYLPGRALRTRGSSLAVGRSSRRLVEEPRREPPPSLVATE